MSHEPTWTAEEDQKLLALWQEHKNFRLCAQLMDRAESTIWEHAGRLGIGEPKSLPKGRGDHGNISRQNPIKVAMEILSTRFEERDSGYYLDGHPAKLNQIMQATNRQLRNSGLSQVDVNPVWVVHD
jgi:hypothetical protein